MPKLSSRDELTILGQLHGNFLERDAYRAGVDCGRNGPDLKNCDFRLFATPALTQAWEQGKAAADETVSLQTSLSESPI